MLPRQYHYLFPKNIVTQYQGEVSTVFPNKGKDSREGMLISKQYFRTDKSLPGWPASINCCGERHVVRPSKDWKSLVFENHADLAELEMMEAFGDEKALRCLIVARAWKTLLKHKGEDPEARKLLPPALRRSFDFMTAKNGGRPGGIEHTLEMMRYMNKGLESDRYEKGASRNRVMNKIRRRAQFAAENLSRSAGINRLPRFPDGTMEWREEIWKPGLHRAVLEVGGLRKAVVVGRAFLLDEKTAKVLVCWPLQRNAHYIRWNEPDHQMNWATAHRKSEEEMGDYSHLPEEERPFPFWEITLDGEER